MRWLIFTMLCAGCLGREQVGQLPRADGGCAERCVESDASASREEQIAWLVRALAGRWVGQASSGGLQADISIEFGRDGSYELRCAPGDETACGLLFFAKRGEVNGSYRVTDVLHGEFFGAFHDPGSVAPDSEFGYLALEGDQLRFERRTLGPNLNASVALVVLERGT